MKTVDLPEWIIKIKQLKELWTENYDPPDIPPTVIVSRNGRLEAMVLADQVDRDKGLFSVSVLRTGFEPDILYAAFETCGKVIPDRDTRLEIGQLQRELDAGSAEILERIMVFGASASEGVKVWELKYRGKGHTFRWLGIGEIVAKHGGPLIEAVRAIMAGADPRTAGVVEASRLLALQMGINDGSASYHRSRASLKYLETRGYTCFDFRHVPGVDDGWGLETEVMP